MRIQPVTDRELLDAAGKQAWDAIAERRGGRVGGPFGVLMHSPAAAERAGRVGDHVRFDLDIPAAERELAIIATAREFDVEVEWAGHVRIALEVGVPEATVEVVAHRGNVSGLTVPEQQIINYVRELLGPKRRVSEATFSALRARFDDRTMVDLATLVGYYAMIGCALNSFEVPLPDGGRPLPPIAR
jgi:4-carboxymuconolactone decarboxylase